MPNRIGIIVDGPGDFAAIKGRLGKTCKVIKTDGPRGHTVSVADLARGSTKQIEILRAFGCRVAIVVTDFESRNEVYNSFRSRLNGELQKYGDDIEVRSAVPNQMIENWFLADVEEISRRKAYIRSGVRQRNYEGRHGKNELKKIFDKKTTYNERKHGFELFGVIRFSVARRNSASLGHFLTNLK